jgi:hypothetical protein
MNAWRQAALNDPVAAELVLKLAERLAGRSNAAGAQTIDHAATADTTQAPAAPAPETPPTGDEADAPAPPSPVASAPADPPPGDEASLPADGPGKTSRGERNGAA